MKCLRTALIVCVCVLCGVSAEAFAEKVQAYVQTAKFVKATEAYRQGDYKEAIHLYEEILATGLESGPLYYNLGNSYFKEKRLGKAIVNYERAKRLIPRDSDLSANDEYAFSLVKSYEGMQKLSFLQRILERYCNYFTVNELTIILMSILFIMGTVHLLGLYLRWPKKACIYIIVTLSVFWILNIGIITQRIKDEKGFAVVIETTEAKFEPYLEATTHFELPEGSKIKILKKEGEWLKVKRLDGKVGWSIRGKVEKI